MKSVKKGIVFLTLLICLTLTVSCIPENQSNRPVTLTDTRGECTALPREAKIVCGSASFAKCAVLAGILPVGVTADAVSDYGLSLPESTVIVGTVKSLDLERIVMTDPDYVMLSLDLTAHLELDGPLDALGIAHGYFRIDTFSEYKWLLGELTGMTEREDLYSEHVLAVEERINKVISTVKNSELVTSDTTVLLMRAFSSGAKAKLDDNLAGRILSELGVTNIASGNPELLLELSTEYIIKEDPDFIFVSTMGNEEGALRYLEETMKSHAAWAELTAVKEGHYIVLPKRLFHYKPCEKWDESYEYLAGILFPELFAEE